MNAIENVFQYISKYILNTGEQLDLDYRTNLSSLLVDVAIVKRTARTYRTVGMLTLSQDMCHDETQIPDMPLLKWTTGKRASIESEAEAFDLLNKGWIMKELRFKRDGRTIDRTYYRMGYRLYEYLQKQLNQEQRLQIRQLEAYRLNASKVLSGLVIDSSGERKALISLLKHLVSTSMNWTAEELEKLDLLPLNWNMAKKMKFLNFVLAFISISSRKEVFDWKEIGAQYYGDIGGSKAFDSYKDEFISVLEEKSGQSAAMLGLISPGKITPLYFAGHVSGKWSSYQPGPVHALTDLSIAQDQYKTNANTLWLVENRGILTRLSAERGFLEKTGSLIACVDGHLRSSHKMFIRQLLQTSQIRQAIFWSDYDESGLLIAGEIAEAVNAYPLTRFATILG